MPLKMRNLVHRDDPNPIQPGIDSDYAHLSRAYLRHLFMAGEMLGPILLTIHNLTYYQGLMKQARQAIESDSFLDFFAERFHGWGLPSTPNGHPSG
jgi:queuine tRNA-ribosyltransferase